MHTMLTNEYYNPIRVTSIETGENFDFIDSPCGHFFGFLSKVIGPFFHRLQQ